MSRTGSSALNQPSHVAVVLAVLAGAAAVALAGLALSVTGERWYTGVAIALYSAFAGGGFIVVSSALRFARWRPSPAYATAAGLTALGFVAGYVWVLPGLLGWALLVTYFVVFVPAWRMLRDAQQRRR